MADFGIDFHTGGRGHFNYPQIRYTIGHKESEELGRLFGAPYLLAKKTILKSLRKYSIESQIPMIVYEGGENLRLDPYSTTHGIDGLKRILIAKKMLSGDLRDKNYSHFGKTSWIRSPKAGMFQWIKQSGQIIKKGDQLGIITDAYGIEHHDVIAKLEGHIIGHNNMPVVSQGDALFHIAKDPLK